jgi:hypothetical protein
MVPNFREKTFAESRICSKTIGARPSTRHIAVGATHTSSHFAHYLLSKGLKIWVPLRRGKGRFHSSVQAPRYRTKFNDWTLLQLLLNYTPIAPSTKSRAGGNWGRPCMLPSRDYATSFFLRTDSRVLLPVRLTHRSASDSSAFVTWVKCGPGLSKFSREGTWPYNDRHATFRQYASLFGSFGVWSRCGSAWQRKKAEGRSKKLE